MKNMTECRYTYVYLLYYKQHSIVHVLAAYCGHFRGGVL